MCRFFLPSGTNRYVLVWWVINNCACALSPRLRTIIQVILISILHMLARMVFFQAHLWKKKKKKKIGHNLVPTHKMFVAFSLCTSQNELKTKGYEVQRQSMNNIRVALCRKTAGKKHPEFQKCHFLIGGKNGHFAKAIAKQNGHKWSQMVSTGTDPQNTNNIQGRMKNQEIRNHTPVCRDLHTLVDT